MSNPETQRWVSDSWHLVLFDPHTYPGDPQRRFDMIGRLIVKEKPPVIVCGGDFSTLDSCSSHELPGTAGEAKLPSLKDDADACVAAQKKMFGPLNEWNKQRLSNRHPRYNPKTFLLKGNHEDRYERWANKNPRQATAINLDELFGFSKNWNNIHPFKQYVTIDGISYTHVPHTTMGKPIGGVNKCRRVSLESSHPTIFGHGHDLQVSTSGTLQGGPATRFALSAPAFMEDGNVEAYAKGNQTGWSYGVLKVYPQGPDRVPAYQYVSMRDMIKQYT